MNKKICLLFIPIIFLITGCSVKKLDTTNYDNLVNDIALGGYKTNNTSFEGFSLNIPYGLRIIEKAEGNLVVADKNNNKYYVYVDVVSYYHKIDLDYDTSKNYYYQKKFKDKKKNSGYLEINEVNNKYFVHASYNYVKIEVYSRKDTLNDVVLNVCQLLSNTKYNNKVLKTTIGDKEISYKEEPFNIFTNKKSTTNYIDYVEKYDKGTMENSIKTKIEDEEIIDIKINED